MGAEPPPPPLHWQAAVLVMTAVSRAAGYDKVASTYCGSKLEEHQTMSAAETACSQLAACVGIADGQCNGPPYTLCRTVQASTQGSCTWKAEGFGADGRDIFNLGFTSCEACKKANANSNCGEGEPVLCYQDGHWGCEFPDGTSNKEQPQDMRLCGAGPAARGPPGDGQTKNVHAYALTKQRTLLVTANLVCQLRVPESRLLWLWPPSHA